MSKRFFDCPILNSPYEYPARHWELNSSGQPTGRILNERRVASFLSAIPTAKGDSQQALFHEGAAGAKTAGQQYELIDVGKS